MVYPGMLKALLILHTYQLINSAEAVPVLSPTVVRDNRTGNEADGDSQITWSGLPDITYSTSGSSDESHCGWRTYYELMHTFVGSTFPKGLPKELIVKALKFDSDLVTNYQEYISYLLGYVVCVGVGLLFLLIFPIVSCCFCCCRCCGKCGGKRIQKKDDASNVCKKNTFTFVVIIVTSFLCVGMAALLDNNDTVTNTLTRTTDAVRDNLDVAQQYLNDSLRQVEKIVKDDLDFMEAVINRDMNNIDVLVGVPLRETIEDTTGIKGTLNKAYALSTELLTVDSALKDINRTFSDLEQSVGTMDQKMKDIRQQLDTIFKSCAGLPTPCPAGPDLGSLTPGIDSSQFPNLTNQMSSVDEASKENLTQKIIEAEIEIDNIPGRVKNDSASVRIDTMAEITKLKDEVEPLVEEFRDFNDILDGDNSMLSDVEADSEYYSDLAKPYDEYRRYGWFGLFTLVLLISIGNVLGTVFGVIGGSGDVKPHHRGCASNTGGCLLMVSAILILFISAVFMLLTTLTFVFGAPLEMIICKNIKDVEQLKELELEYMGEGKYELGKLIHNNDTIPLTFSGLLADCKNDKPVFEAVQLEQRVDIDDMLNYTKYFDIEEEIDKINVDLSSVNVYSPELKDQLNASRNALDVNFTAFQTEMNVLTTPDSLDDLIKQLEDFRDKVAAIGLNNTRDQLNVQINATRSVQAVEYLDVQTKITALNNSLVAMETSVSAVKPLIESLDKGLVATDQYIKTNASQDIKMLLKSYGERLLRVVESFASHAKTSVKTEIGRCRPLWNVYESIFVDTLCGGLVDALFNAAINSLGHVTAISAPTRVFLAFPHQYLHNILLEPLTTFSHRPENGFWFSLGWCVFFFLPSLVFSVKLSKFFRRMEAPPSKRGSNVPNQRKMTTADQWLRQNKVHHSDYDSNW